MNIVQRVKNILLSAKSEWPVIASEPASIQSIYVPYVLILAALGPIAVALGQALFGIPVPFIGKITVPFSTILISGIGSFVVGLLMTYLMAFIIDLFAPSFGGEKNFVQALKTSAYGWTPAFVFAIVGFVPFLGILGLVGMVWAIYTIYVGLPHTMKSPAEKSAGYTAVVMIIGIILGLTLGFLVSLVSGVSALTSGAAKNALGLGDLGSDQPELVIDKDSALGQLAGAAKGLEAAGKQLEEANKSGDSAAAEKAVGDLIGAALGGGQKVESLGLDQLKGFLPETLAGLSRKSFSTEKNGAFGMNISVAKARYSDDSGNADVNLEITDLGTAKGALAFAGFVNVEKESQSDTGYEKTYKNGDQWTTEKWDNGSKSGEYSIIVGERFAVKLEGRADSIDDFKSAMSALDLNGLAALKDQGVTKQ